MAAFDAHSQKWSQRIKDVLVQNPAQFYDVVQAQQIEIGVIAVSLEAA